MPPGHYELVEDHLMTNQQMITAIVSSIQTDANVLLVMRAIITNNVPNVSTAQLQAICAVLGINTGGQ